LLIVALLVLLALLTPVAYLAYRIRRPWSPYVLRRVVSLAPDAGRFVSNYLESFYLYRVADPDAREALRLLARRKSDDGPLGICIVGPAMLGKTRLAWEAIQAELPEWTLLRWPLEGRPPLDFASLRGERVVLWLDDLHKYANFNLAATINDLPRRLTQVGVRFVIVATCRDGDETALASIGLGPLLDRLIEISPIEVSDGDVAWHSAALKYRGVKLLLDEFDGTPGSIILGAQRMREESYPALPRSARRILWAMKLLRSAGIYVYPLERVRAAVQDVFRLEPAEWKHACKALEKAGFLRVEKLPGGRQALVPVADLYLDAIVPNFSAPGAHISEGWPELEKSLAQRQDADALNQLGLAFLELDVGSLLTNAQHAEACFRAALAAYQRRNARASWAIARRNLGLAYWSQAQAAEGTERALLLAQAVDTYRLAWRVGVWENIPLHGALTQQSMGAALNRRAALAQASEREKLLAESITAYREALLIYERTRARDDWAITQQNLGAALSDQARLEEGERQAALLAQAVDAYRAALTVYTREETPGDWALTQNNLGLALMQQAAIAAWDQQAALLQEALVCHQAALDMMNQEVTPGGWALTQVNLGNVLRRQAGLAACDERAALLERALAAYRAALTIYTPDCLPDDWAMTQNNLGNALRDQAVLLEGKERLALLRQAAAAHQAALTIYTRDYAPIEWAGTHLNLAQAHLSRAQSLKGGQREKAKPLAEAAACADHALVVFTPDLAPTYHAQAQRLRDEIAALS
jgi:tetratricopeptide (TPR) repeat protein